MSEVAGTALPLPWSVRAAQERARLRGRTGGSLPVRVPRPAAQEDPGSRPTSWWAS
jgi:hypothetical protein